MKNLLLIAAFAIAYICFSCEGNDENQSSLTINEFYIEAENDTVPCKVNVITSSSSNGLNSFLYIHEGAFIDEKFCEQKDSTNITSMSTEEYTSIDTLELYYNKEGNYQISLKVNDSKYSEEICLYSSK